MMSQNLAYITTCAQLALVMDLELIQFIPMQLHFIFDPYIAI